MKAKKETIDIALGKELRKLRKNKQLSLEDISLRVGCSRQTIYYYETGDSSVSIPMLIKLCDIYGVEYYDVLEKVRKFVYRK